MSLYCVDNICAKYNIAYKLINWMVHENLMNQSFVI